MPAQLESLSTADKKWGYRFGCDGLMSMSEVCSHLSLSTWTVNRLVDKNMIRKGKHPLSGRVAFCKRSIESYIAMMEV